MKKLEDHFHTIDKVNNADAYMVLTNYYSELVQRGFTYDERTKEPIVYLEEDESDSPESKTDNFVKYC